ncbi:unnamed protein product [Brassica oleracea var. botrytis]|uniref:Uncharacterized protein n=3 Tax=Brassica TaxID=3705 RepID=A0A3P6DC13_BRACM|nr:unnamed protein product [Brassica napus]VDD24490.1 unnamed protein product [Brassica rapa]VDD65252.1 unnamed protein product [Brassica oleracea]CAF2058879.1 unnamed protein product [Brassica napus]CAF2381126.1 unnamed protein product [Brassica napus]
MPIGVPKVPFRSPGEGDTSWVDIYPFRNKKKPSPFQLNLDEKKISMNQVSLTGLINRFIILLLGL